MLLRFAYQEFINEKELEGLQKSTINHYQLLFSDFLQWSDSEEVSTVEQVTSRVLKRYLLHCKTDRKNNASTMNTKTKLFKTFFNFLVSEELLDINPAIQIKKVKEDNKIQSFSDDELKQMLSHLRRNKRKENDFHSIRNYSLFLVLLGTGMRIGELVSIKWSDINYENGYMMIFSGKTRQGETVPMTDTVARELAHWKVYCEDRFKSVSPYVFVNQRGKPLTVNAIKCFFKRLSAHMEFDSGTRVSAHTLRHTFARKFIENGGDVSVLSKILRHSSISTTERYLNFFSNSVAEDNDKYNALNGLNL